MSASPHEAVAIRQAAPEDGPALVAAIETIDTETDFLGEPGERMPWAERPEQQLRTFGEKDSAVYFVALAAGAVVGYLGAYRGWLARNRGVLFVAHVGIRAAFRGRRIGTRLFEAVEAWAAARGIHRLELRVDEENARGLALYRRRGFVVEGRLAASYRGSDGLRNHLWMGKAGGDPLPDAVPFVPALPEPRLSVDDVRIRPVVPEDGAALQLFERRLLGALPEFFLKSAAEVRSEVALIEADLAGMLKRPGAQALAAFDAGGAMVAYAALLPELPRRMTHEASCTINVLPAWWGCGLGRLLVGELESRARAHGIRRIAGGLQANNRRGLGFAKAAGFRTEAMMRRYSIVDGCSVDRIRLVLVPG